MENKSLRSPSDVNTTMMYIYALNRDMVGVEFINGSGVKLIRIRCRDQPRWTGNPQLNAKGLLDLRQEIPRRVMWQKTRTPNHNAGQSNHSSAPCT